MFYLFMTALVCGVVYLAVNKKDGWGWLVFILIMTADNNPNPDKGQLDKIQTLQIENKVLTERLTTAESKIDGKDTKWSSTTKW